MASRGGAFGAAAAAAAATALTAATAAVSGSGVPSGAGAGTSIRMVKSSGPILSVSLLTTARSSFWTRASLTSVPLVLPKSRTNTLPSRTTRAQCCLLTAWLAGRNWHCGSRPMRNCGVVIGITLP